MNRSKAAWRPRRQCGSPCRRVQASATFDSVQYSFSLPPSINPASASTMPWASHSWAMPEADGKTISGVPKSPNRQTWTSRPMAWLGIRS